MMLMTVSPVDLGQDHLTLSAAFDPVRIRDFWKAFSVFHSHCATFSWTFAYVSGHCFSVSFANVSNLIPPQNNFQKCFEPPEIYT